MTAPNQMPHMKTRVQLDLSPIELERMNKTMYVCDIETRKDLFNNALSLFEWAVNEAMSGKQIGSIDKKSQEFTILSMPALSTASAHGPNYRPAISTHRAHNDHLETAE